MKTLYIERSTGNARNGAWVEELDLEGVERIVVGIGPGSFAGIRAALAFAQGYSIGSKCEVSGLPSACASAARFIDLHGNVAVLGDARQGKAWVALFKGYSLEREIFQVDEECIYSSVPGDYVVVSPDDSRIGGNLKAVFGDRYLGEALPSGEMLEKFALKAPSLLVAEPLPIYLNPAVRN